MYDRSYKNLSDDFICKAGRSPKATIIALIAESYLRGFLNELEVFYALFSICPDAAKDYLNDLYLMICENKECVKE